MFCFKVLMEIWAVVAILILLVAIAGFVGLTIWKEIENSKKQQNNILYPFSGSVDPSDTGKNVVLKTSNGRNQIECPVGYKINIVGAFVEVDDPFGECSPSPGSTFRATCGDDNDRASAIKCSASSPCSKGLIAGMDCVEGKCLPKTCSAAKDCGNPCPVNPGKACKTHSDCGGSPMMCTPDGTCQVDSTQGQCMFCRNGKCAQAPTCSNLNKSYQNITCESSNEKTKCRPRDASAYLAKACDGKQSCTVSWNPSNNEFFGPLPCSIGVRDADYATLPIIAGWDGGKPSKGKSAEQANFKQGYYVHGLFSCIKDE